MVFKVLGGQDLTPCHGDWSHDMVDGSEIRLYNQLRLVVSPMIYEILAPSQVVGLGISKPSTVCQVMYFLGSCAMQTTEWDVQTT